MIRRLADTLLRAGAHLAPPARRRWVEALRAEADLIERPVDALSWAVGGLFAALGWAVRREAPFVILFAAALYGQLWLGILGVEAGLAIGLPFMLAAQITQNGAVLIQALAFAAWRPSHAVLAALAAPALGWIWLFGVFLRHADHLPVPWTFYLASTAHFGWPAVVGAVAGAVIGRRWLGRA